MKKYSSLFLFISLVVNIFLLGWLVGQWSGDKVKDRTLGRKPYVYSQDESTYTLSDEKTALLHERLQDARKKGRDIHREIRKLRANIVDILVAEKFDKDAYEKKTLKLHELHGELMLAMAKATKSLALEFSQEERKALAQYLKKRPPHHKGRKSRDEMPFGGSSPPHVRGDCHMPPPERRHSGFSDHDRPPPPPPHF